MVPVPVWQAAVYVERIKRAHALMESAEKLDRVESKLKIADDQIEANGVYIERLKKTLVAQRAAFVELRKERDELQERSNAWQIMYSGTWDAELDRLASEAGELADKMQAEADAMAVEGVLNESGYATRGASPPESDLEDVMGEV